jgi:hypothetical protein
MRVKKSLMINRDENKKNKRHLYIKIFDFATRTFNLVMFNKFVYQNQIFI